MTEPEKRPKNREVEDEMVRPPKKEGEPPRPATEPARGKDADARKR
ncbi:hypothetical protein [Novosphingobium sp. TCA1]|nr:hypothetical protein [Novosphingobium sp. TCA1]GFE73840.1 hypothetical protein NTCA1_14890 [Novosphingobium sp. TCA1]